MLCNLLGFRAVEIPDQFYLSAQLVNLEVVILTQTPL